MIPRRAWLALASSGLGALRASAQAPRPAPAAPSQGTVTVELPAFEGVSTRDIEADDLQTLDYLASFKRYPTQPSANQTGWLLMAQQAMAKPGEHNLAWRLYALYHGTRSGLPAGELLDIAAALNFLPESRIARPSGRLPVRLEPWFRFDRPLKTKAIIKLVVEDEAGKPLGTETVLTPERLEPLELSLPFEAPAGATVYARYTLSAEDGKVFAEVRRPVLLDGGYRQRADELAAKGGQLVLDRGTRMPTQEIGARTILRIAERYNAALRSYAVPFGERMHPFVAGVMKPAVPRTWTASVSGDAELKALETLAVRLSAAPSGAGIGPADLNLPRLVWSPGEGDAEETFRVLLPDNFTPGRKWPVVVALHSEFGDQGSLADMFLGADGKTSLLADEARKRGYLVLLPSAGAPFAWFLEPALTRIPRLVRRFREVWPVDEKQVFLWGHSLGATLAYRMMNIRDLWAGVAVTAGVPQRNFDFNTPADIPLAMIAGEADPLIQPRQMLVISYRLQRAVKQREMITLPGQDHWSVGAAAIPAAFAYFDKLRAQPPAAAPAK